jgi:coiled-coil and C2 domain-containing protein 2A
MTDAICQLKQVGCIIGQDNVWANVQEFDDPALISFDLDNEKEWKPFLNKTNRIKYFTNGVIQPEQSPVLKYMKPMEKERADIIAMKI